AEHLEFNMPTTGCRLIDDWMLDAAISRSARFLNFKVDCVDIRLSKAAALDADQAAPAEFADELSHPGTAHPHVGGEPLLPRKAGFIVPSVAQEHGVSHLGANGQIRVF